MKITDQIIIPKSKRKLVLLVLVSIVFVVLGIRIISSSHRVDNSFFDSIYFRGTIGVLSIGFFGVAGAILLYRLGDKRAGLIIDETGIIDNSSAVAAGHIPWRDMEAIKETNVWTEKFITVILKNPAHYVNNAQNKWKRKILQSNYKRNGSPVNISANGLSITHSELKALLQEKLSRYNQTIRTSESGHSV